MPDFYECKACVGFETTKAYILRQLSTHCYFITAVSVLLITIVASLIKINLVFNCFLITFL